MNNMLFKIEESIKPSLDNCREDSFVIKWGNDSTIFCFDNKGGQDIRATPPPLIVDYKYYKTKKWGGDFENPTKGKVSVMMSYCPFCGSALHENNIAA
jgi:hypothetical protein